MKPAQLSALIVAAWLFPATLPAAPDGESTGIIKGSITLAGKPAQDVVVSLEGVSQASIKAALAGAHNKKAVISQRKMNFVPHLLPVLVGTTVEFPNDDNTFHNVYSKGGAKDFDLGLYPAGKTRSATFDKPGVAHILCNVHPSMEAFIVIKEHPYFSAVDSRGNYRIDAVPLGQYRVEVWHPQLGTTSSEVQLVRTGEVLDVNFDLKKK